MKRGVLLLTILGSFSLCQTGWGKTSGVQAKGDFPIDRVDVTGVQVIPEAMIESALEIGPGDPLDRRKVVRSEENLQAIYRAKGFEEMRVQTRLLRKRTAGSRSKNQMETNLEFNIIEGRPLRISEVRLVPADAKDVIAPEQWKKMEAKIRKGLSLQVGDVLDQEKLTAAKRAIQEDLVSNDYMGAGVNKIKTLKGEVPSDGVDSQELQNVARWVVVEFQVDVGDRVSFGFRGNSFLTWGQLSALVEEQRALGLGKDYMNAVQRRIEDEYRSVGFSKVSISPLTIEDSIQKKRRVSFVITEGPRVKIDSIEFDGNLVFSSEVLRKEFYLKASAIVQNGIFVEKDVQKAAELLTEWMKEKGYLSAKLVTINMTYPSKSKPQLANASVKLVVYLYEGNQTVIGSIDVGGLKVIGTKEVNAILHIAEGKPLNLFALAEGIDVLKQLYRNKGYLDFKIENEGAEGLIKYSQENRQAEIHLEFVEGPEYRVSEIRIEGLTKTKEFVVSRELTFHEKEILGQSLLVDSEWRLKRLGIFSSASIFTLDDPDHPDMKIVQVKLIESERGILTGGPGIRNDLGIRVFGQMTYANLWGLNHTISVTGSANRRFERYNFIEGQAQVTYSWPWFLKPELNFRPTINGGRTQYFDFAADNLTVTLNWDKSLSTKPSLIAYLAYAFESIRQFNAVRAIDNDGFRINTLTPRLTLDMRDSPLTPTSGLYTTAWFDFAPPIFGTGADEYPIGYYRAQFRADYSIPLPKSLVWHTSFRTGYEKSMVTSTDPSRNTIPLIKQFTLGGIGSLRGFQELELNAQNISSQGIQGSLAYVNYRSQVDIPVAGSLKFDVFLDAANLLIDSYSFSEKLYYDAGIGIRYLTPVGSVNVDWGFKLNPPPNSAVPYVVHFSVGVI